MARTLSVADLLAIDFSKYPQAQPYPAMQFFPKEWLTGQATRAMSAEQNGGFINLIAEAWDQKPPCSLPNDASQLANYARLGSGRWAKAGALILAQFVECSDGRLRNPKQVSVWLNMLTITDKRRGKNLRKDNKGASDVPTKGTSVSPPASTDADADATRKRAPEKKPEGVQGEPSAPFDFEAAAPLVQKIQAADFTYAPSDQICIALIREFGAELIQETLIDCEPQYKGKAYQYFERILSNRRNNPDERPGNRRRGSPRLGNATVAGSAARRHPKSFA